MILNGVVLFLLNVSMLINLQCLLLLIPKKNEIIKRGDKHHRIWISQPTSGLEKRQYALQVCARADGKQPRIAVIFWGKGKRVRPDEKAVWHLYMYHTMHLKI